MWNMDNLMALCWSLKKVQFFIFQEEHIGYESGKWQSDH